MEQTQPTRLFIDCEFNEFKGDLISMAIVAEDGREFYEVTHCDQPGAWVAQHVMPILNKAPISMRELQAQLFLFLAQFEAIHVVADWPEDIKHFCDALITGPGMRMDTPPLTMEVRRDLDSELSAVPHNALDDARAVAAKAAELGLLRSQQPVSGGALPKEALRAIYVRHELATANLVFSDLERIAADVIAAARISAPQAVGHLSPDELDLCRQWFDSVQDLNGGYLNKADYMLAQRLYVACGMRVPSSISISTTPPTQGDGNEQTGR